MKIETVRVNQRTMSSTCRTHTLHEIHETLTQSMCLCVCVCMRIQLNASKINQNDMRMEPMRTDTRIKYIFAFDFYAIFMRAHIESSQTWNAPHNGIESTMWTELLCSMRVVLHLIHINASTSASARHQCANQFVPENVPCVNNNKHINKIKFLAFTSLLPSSISSTYDSSTSSCVRVPVCVCHSICISAFHSLTLFTRIVCTRWAVNTSFHHSWRFLFSTHSFVHFLCAKIRLRHSLLWRIHTHHTRARTQRRRKIYGSEMLFNAHKIISKIFVYGLCLRDVIATRRGCARRRAHSGSLSPPKTRWFRAQINYAKLRIFFVCSREAFRWT